MKDYRQYPPDLKNLQFCCSAGIALVFLLATFSLPVHAQSYDLLLKGGHVIDPKNGINVPMDVVLMMEKSPV